MGFIQDGITLEHFAGNMAQFKQDTDAFIRIIVQEVTRHRGLRRGLYLPDFMEKISHNSNLNNNQAI